MLGHVLRLDTSVDGQVVLFGCLDIGGRSKGPMTNVLFQHGRILMDLELEYGSSAAASFFHNPNYFLLN